MLGRAGANSKPAPDEASCRENCECARFLVLSSTNSRRLIRVGVRRAGVRHLAPRRMISIFWCAKKVGTPDRDQRAKLNEVAFGPARALVKRAVTGRALEPRRPTARTTLRESTGFPPPSSLLSRLSEKPWTIHASTQVCLLHLLQLVGHTRRLAQRGGAAYVWELDTSYSTGFRLRLEAL